MSNPYAEIGSEKLVRIKDGLARDLLKRLIDLNIAPDYAITVMNSARNLPMADRVRILEYLVEIEAIKYTLAARRVRELDPESM